MKKGSSNYYSNCVLTIVSMIKICGFSKKYYLIRFNNFAIKRGGMVSNNL